ncbi:MAG TPA: phosphoribulokinase [Candidatus Limnocylindria bacterium]|nr:phosphoribulokinase [Candidatus Limnocylindria bacterium]
MTRPIMVAVGGDSGTGKSTLCKGLDAIFGAGRIVEICLDDYHSLDRAQRKAVGLTALDPRANNFAAMEDDLARLAEGETITKPVYDHRDGTFAAPETVAPREIVIVQGLFPLYTRALRALFDVSVWLDPQADLKVAWKVQRDCTQRGYREDEVRAEIAKRQPDIDEHIAPQERHADLCVRFSRQRPSIDNAKLNARIVKGGRFAPLDYRDFASRSTHLRQIDGGEGPYPRTIIELDGDVDAVTAAEVQELILSHMDARHRPAEIGTLGLFRDARGERVSHTLALAQLLIARRICLVADERSAVAA